MYSYNLNKNVPISYSIELYSKISNLPETPCFLLTLPKKKGGELVRLNILLL